VEWFQVIALAVIQGLTEFLPISSSAHLILPSQLFGWRDQGLAFDVGVHIGSLLAVLYFFRHDLLSMTKSCVSAASTDDKTQARIAWLVVIATLPALMFGFMFHGLVDLYGRSLLVIAGTTMIFGGLLWWADVGRSEARNLTSLSLRDAVTIGCAQAVALIPGTSRSGITISAGLMLGLDRQAAARFSFLMSIPVILGAGVFKTLELASTGVAGQWLMLLSGTGIAAVSAFCCIHFFLKWLDQIGMLPFVIYRMLLGVVLLAIYFMT